VRVSVIVPNYNYEKYIGRTIRSLLAQNFPRSDYEVIVIDDGSTDKSLTVLEPYLGQIEVVTQSHKGQASACNEGFHKAQGQYIVRVDSDDYVNTNFLLVESLFIEHNKGFSGVCCDYYKVDEWGNILSRGDAVKEPIACGVMFRHERLLAAGFYNGDVPLWEEQEFMQRYLPVNDVYHLPLPLYRYFQHSGSLTHKEKEC